MAANKKQLAFITSLAPAAQQTQQAICPTCHKCHGIPSSITLAQAILESGWGKTRLAVEYNNFFGIKRAHGDSSESYVEFRTGEYIKGTLQLQEADFVWYKTVADCFRAHDWLIAHQARYAPAMAATHSAPAFALALQTCGYSTNRPPLAKKGPFYADVLMDLVDEFNLTQYDVPPAPSDPANTKAA